jgi:Cof subfamily protein (haloacid dehalogenase superfamily)
MQYKAIISDLDGTLLNSNHTVSEYTCATIRDLTDKGVNFFIATGRHYSDIVHLREKLNLDTFFISSNGARVHDFKGNVVIKHDIEGETVRELLGMSIDKSIHVNIYTNDKWLVSRENELVSNFHSNSGFFYNLVDFNKLEDYEAMKIFYVCEDEETLVKLGESIQQKFEGKVDVTFSAPKCLEIMKKGISKGTTISDIFAREGICLEDTLAFGDGFNDYEMLKLVGKGLIMGNAHKKLKEALPENEIIGTNDDHSVAKYLKKIFLVG